MEPNWLRPLLEFTPFLPALPFIALLFYFRKAQKELLSENVRAGKLDEFLRQALVYFPSSSCVKLNAEITGIKVRDLFVEPASSRLLEIVHDEENITNRIDQLTESPVAECLGLFAIFLMVVTFLLKLDKDMVGVIVLISFILSLLGFLVISRWEFQVRQTMRILQDHLANTPATAQQRPIRGGNVI